MVVIEALVFVELDIHVQRLPRATNAFWKGTQVKIGALGRTIQLQPPAASRYKFLVVRSECTSLASVRLSREVSVIYCKHRCMCRLLQMSGSVEQTEIVLEEKRGCRKRIGDSHSGGKPYCPRQKGTSYHLGPELRRI